MLLAVALAVISVPILVQILLENFSTADEGALRLKSFKLAIATIPNYFFFGVGEDSAFGKTYQNLFGKTFFPTDIGLIGIMFKYGAVGLSLYLALHILILDRLWRANLIVKEASKQHDPILWAVLILITAQSLNLVLIAGLGYAQGITTGSMSLAYTCLLSQDANKSLQNANPKLQIVSQ